MTLYLDSLQPLLPDAIRKQLDRALLPEAKAVIEAILRLAVGAEAPASGLLPGWDELQPRACKIVDDLKRSEHTRSSQKRPRDDDSGSASKRVRTDDVDAQGTAADDPRVFSLQSISVSAPIRKKVNIDLHRCSIRLTNPSSHQEECPAIPLSALRRAFLLPTRGKSKPHWTVALLPSDIPTVPPKGPAAKDAAASAPPSPQLVFGLDATLAAALTTSTPDADKLHAKGQPSLPALRAFLDHLPILTLEPSTAVFRSATAGSQDGGGVAGVEAYRGAKEGTLWFLDAGVLWDGKPCEFFALDHLAPVAADPQQPVAGVRTLSATGRTCSVILRRIGGGAGAASAKPKAAGANGKGSKGQGKGQTDGSGEDGEGEDDDDDDGVDVDFGMVDGREQEPIGRWIKARRHLFGRASDAPPFGAPSAQTGASTAPAADAKGKGKGKAQANPRDADPRNEDTEDEEDSDFEADSSEDESSGSGGDDSDASGHGGGGGGSDEGDASDDATGDEMDAEEEEEELDPKHHPLLRPGAMPRMSRAAVEAVVGMVEQDMAAGGSRVGAASAGSEDDEEDELDD